MFLVEMFLLNIFIFLKYVLFLRCYIDLEVKIFKNVLKFFSDCV